MRNNKKNWMPPWLTVTLALLIVCLAGCESYGVKERKLVTPEKKVYRVVKGQTIRIINEDNEEVDYEVGAHIWIIHSSKIDAIAKKVFPVE